VIGIARPGRIKGQNIFDEGQELFPVGKPEKRTDSAAYGTAGISVGKETPTGVDRVVGRKIFPGGFIIHSGHDQVIPQKRKSIGQITAKSRGQKSYYPEARKDFIKMGSCTKLGNPVWPPFRYPS
jgi:hypothetical protein